jgi:hypothetical protein
MTENVGGAIERVGVIEGGGLEVIDGGGVEKGADVVEDGGLEVIDGGGFEKGADVLDGTSVTAGGADGVRGITDVADGSVGDSGRKRPPAEEGDDGASEESGPAGIAARIFADESESIRTDISSVIVAAESDA